MLNWLINLKFAIKMAVIAVLAMVAVVVPTRTLYFNLNDSIAFTDLEVQGLAPADGVLKLSQQLHLLAQGQTSASTVQAELSTLQSLIQQQLPDSDASNKMASLQQEWQSFSQPSPEQLQVFTQRLNTELMNAILESSGLSYDPVAASYHLIVAAYQNMPRVLVSLTQLRHLGEKQLSLAADDPAQSAIRLQIAQQQQLLAAPLGDFVHNVKQASVTEPQVAAAGLDKELSKLEQSIAALQRALTTPTSHADFVALANPLLEHAVLMNQHTSSLLQSLMQQRSAAAHSEQNSMMWSLVALLAVAMSLGVFIVINTNRAIIGSVRIANAIAAGDFSQARESHRQDEVGELLQALWQMNSSLQQAAVQAQELQARTAADAERARQEAEAARENTRIRQALDESSTNVLIADRAGMVVYVNKAMQQLLQHMEPVLRARQSMFSAASVVGQPLEHIYRVYSSELQPLAHLNRSQMEDLELSGIQLRVIASPIRNAQGERLGTVLEWQNRTQEVQAELEIAQAVSAAARGDFSLRLREQGKQGFFLELAKQLNVLIDQSASSLRDINQVLQALADGDLTQRVQANYQGEFDALKQNCNQSCDNLARLITNLRDVAQTIQSASNEISTGNNDLASRTEQQASSLEETASGMEELSGTVQTNAQNARQAAGLAKQAREVADENGQMIQQLVQTMAGINQAARRIADIIGVIDGIAFQTNILALNAAVEAARAGDQGRGFAVVASEVRTLAQRSANAAKDIKSLIDDSVRQITAGNELAGRSGGQVSKVLKAISDVSVIMDDIATASSQQADGIGEVAKAISQMDGMTQQNAALVEEASAAAESLQNQAHQLFSQIAAVRLNDQNELPSAAAKHPHKSTLPSKATARPAPAKLPPKQTSKPSAASTKQIRSLPASQQDDEWESF